MRHGLLVSVLADDGADGLRPLLHHILGGPKPRHCELQSGSDGAYLAVWSCGTKLCPGARLTGKTNVSTVPPGGGLGQYSKAEQPSPSHGGTWAQGLGPQAQVQARTITGLRFRQDSTGTGYITKPFPFGHPGRQPAPEP